MNVLLLTKLDDKDPFLLAYAAHILKDEGATLHLLNVVTVPGDVPLKLNGEVLDECTEFDLSGYLSEQKENLAKMATYSAGDLPIEYHSKVGNGLTIIQTYIEENDIQLIISGAHVSSKMEDIFSTTFASRLMHEVKLPLLTLKCERANAPVAQIGILREFKEPKQENLEVVKMLQKKFGSTITLYKINTPKDMQPEEEIKKQMQVFCEVNGLGDCECKIIEADDYEGATRNLIIDEELDFLALGHIHRAGAAAFLRGELKDDILNHIMVPIYIY